MSMNYKEVPQRVSEEEATRYAKGIQIMNDLADSLQRQGEIPKRFSKPEPAATPVAPKADELQPARVEAIKIYPEISLEEEWQRQIQRFIKLRFHTELGQTEKEYEQILPKFTSQPEGFKGRLDTPVIVETRIPIERQRELVVIEYYLGNLNKRDWPNDPKKYKTPDSAYVAWMDEGARNMNRKVEDVRKELPFDERGGTELDGIALYISRPNILQTRFLDLPGTAAGSGSASCLLLLNGRPRLGYKWVGDADPMFGSLVCGRQK